LSQHFDAIIIGTGQAGPSLAARFADAGKTVAIIERHKFGGTCVNTGCIPTKTLVASAYAAQVARRGGEYGFSVNGDVRVDMKRVKARKDAVSGRSNKGVEEWLRGLKNCTVIEGHARFQSSNTVVVNDEALQADKIFINVGGRASVPEMPGIHGFCPSHAPGTRGSGARSCTPMCLSLPGKVEPVILAMGRGSLACSCEH
jgi:pyruvate/2-oxoglutarate dehydrogenase complex dihydrolipoamide dehydrogenase (E3) component